MSINSLSNELMLVKYRQGVKLLSPEDTHGTPVVSNLGHLIRLPYSVYLLDKMDSIFLHMNDVNAELLSAPSTNDLLGRNVTHFSDSHSAETVLNNDRKVLQSENILLIEEEADLTCSDLHVHCLTFKMPCYNADNTLLGIFGISIPLDRYVLANGISDLSSLGLLTAPIKSETKQLQPLPCNGKVLSKREIEVLHCIGKGLSAKLAAKKLFLSVRTVEHHIENIKHKTGVKSKYDLVDLYNQQGDLV